MVTPCYHPVKGGTEQVVRNLSITLNKRGIHTDIMTFNINRKWHSTCKGKIEKIDGLSVYKIPALNWFPLTHSNRITMGINLIPGRFINRLKNYDIIHFHEDLTFPFFSYFVNKPKIFHLHGLDVDFYKRYFLSRFILNHIADRYICLTKIMEKNLTELGVPKDKIRRLPNGVDVNIFHPSGEKKDNLALFVGRISPEKGLHVLLKSLHYLEKSIHLVIIGPPGWNHTYYEGILRLMEKENKKGKHKITYLGSQDQANIIEWYRKASILVLPSFGEALSVVCIEALSCETPVVATNVGGVPEVVRDGENGILVPPNDVVKLAEAIQFLLNNEEVRSKFGRRGRKWVMKQFSLEAVVEKLQRFYKEILS